MSFEDELGEALRRIGNTFDSDQQTLLTTGVERGRRTVRRRRVLAVTASVVALGLMGSGAYAGGLLGDGSGETNVAREAPSLDSGRVFEIWKKLAPAGTFSQEKVLPRKPGEYAHVSFVYDDGKGAGLVEFRMGKADLRAGAEGCEPADRKCRARSQTDGARSLNVESHEAPYTTLDTKSVRHQIITPEGFVVEATVWNTPDPRQATGTRKVPVLMYDLHRLNANEWRNELKKFPVPDPLGGEPAVDPAFVNPLGKISGTELTSTFKGLLPAGSFSDEKGRGTGDQLGPAASFVYDDGKGKAGVTAELYRVDPHGYSTRQYTSCRRVPHCTVTTSADGSKVRVYREEYGKSGGFRKFWTATYLSPQGHMVEISEWNTPERDGGRATRDTPPLTVEQLRVLVSSKKWQPALDELPAAPEESVGGATRPTWHEADEYVRQLMHLRQSAKSGNPHVKGCDSTCWSRLTLNKDGLGAGSVEVSLDKSRTNKTGDTLLDVRQERVEAGGKGAVRWIVTASLPGGKQVTLTAYNAPTPDADATRNSPPLNVPLLKKIALASQWNDEAYLKAMERPFPSR
ncbi:hypothetical protein J7E87_28025 [Streptomyces sp. ISL-1]|uniref:hypothetical protein n=1 Tax=Streptomyces sp. ISL-1 TaxID=2817657 RepID=UPI001BE8CE15|nr:hypothetical protein [Streptomyces sp. ISL-1]MBT2393171.1 hypothetical protein [Streptomyces sp. ISL-1]